MKINNEERRREEEEYNRKGGIGYLEEEGVEKEKEGWKTRGKGPFHQPTKGGRGGRRGRRGMGKKVGER